MDKDFLIGTDQFETYRYCLRVIRRITRGRAVGIFDQDDLANITASKFFFSDNPDKLKNPKAFIYGIARNVFLESLRAKRRDEQMLQFAEVPSLGDEQSELPILQGEFLERLSKSLSPGEQTITAELMHPDGRTRRQIASDLGKSESALSEAIRRISAKANRVHHEMVSETLTSMNGNPTFDLQYRLIGLARTPSEQADLRLRTVQVCQQCLSGGSLDLRISKSSLLQESNRQLQLAWKSYANLDPLFIATLHITKCRQFALHGIATQKDLQLLMGDVIFTALSFLDIADQLQAVQAYAEFAPLVREHRRLAGKEAELFKYVCSKLTFAPAQEAAANLALTIL